MLIRGATVLSMDPEIGDLAKGDVLIDGARIVEVGADLGNPTSAGETIDASGCLIVPGFVDTHRHMWQGALRGLMPHGTLDEYFRRVLLGIGPSLTAADLAVSEALSARASLAAGITTVQDTSDIHDRPERTDAIIAALMDSGLRVVFAYGLSRPYLMQHGSALPDDVRRVRAELLHDDHALVTMALATSNGHDDDERHNAALARELGVRAAHHVRAEIPPSRLQRLGALNPGTTFVHGNGLGPHELMVIAEAGGALSIAPVVELALGLGTPMIDEALAVPGLTVSLSTDIETTGPTDMFSQMRAAYLTARPPLRHILHMATLGGAQALGLDDRIGSLTPGKQADLLVLRTDSADTTPMPDPYGAVVLQMDRSHMDTVMVGGTIHTRHGKPVHDDSSLRERARAVSRRLTA